MLIYVAGWFGSQKRLRAEKEWLESQGHKVISSWLDEKVDDPTKITTKDLLPGDNTLIAAKDFWEIGESNLVIIDTIDVTDRGGREVELGYAMAKGIQVILIGPERNVFHYLIRHRFPTWEDLKKASAPNV